MNDRAGMRYLFLALALLLSCGSGCRPKERAMACEIPLDEGWFLQAAEKISATGGVIASPNFDPAGWYSTSVPSTVLAALVRNGEVIDPFFGKNLELISAERFRGPWWYRKEFELPKLKDFSFVRLRFNGINYRANVWLNGRKIASQEGMAGAFRVFEVDISEVAQPGKNFLAVEVFPPQRGDLTIGFVDWNPEPPDRSMGIWRPVTVRLSGSVSIENPFVLTDVDGETLDEAFLTVISELVNHTEQEIEGVLQAELEKVSVDQKVRLGPGEKRAVTFNSENFNQLHLRHPRLWWPHPWGEQNLFKLRLKFVRKKAVLDEREVRFGIRKVEEYITAEGHRGFKINGQKILIRGGGWVDDLFLADDERTLEAKVRYIRHMNLNAIRLEGFWGTSHKLYDLCDRLGVLIMAGWSCQWEWDSYAGKPCDEYGGVQTPEEMELIARSFQDQILLWRNHPSVFVWLLGSDKLPRPELEQKYRLILKNYDPSRPALAAAAGRSSEVSGPTRVKMNGPYDYVPPIYWFEDNKNGGAFGFNTESGPGPQPPPLESLKKMIPENHLWPIDEVWDFHCARGQFNSLARYVEALHRRYGETRDVYEFVRKAQVANYEAMRAMFEAFVARKHRSTGLIQWMLNAAWPKLHWQLYDYYLMPNGAFYGAKKAGQPLHILFDYQEKSICAANDYLEPRPGLRARIQLLDLKGEEIFKEEKSFDLEANSSLRVMELPSLPVKPPVYFLDLELEDESGATLSDNFYWLSAKDDVMDYPATQWFVTPIKEFADFRALDSLPPVKVKTEWNMERVGLEGRVQVTLMNPAKAIAFFIEVGLVKSRSGNSVLPVYWDDNYITLLPGECRTLEATFLLEDLGREELAIAVNGWNVASEISPKASR
ncbi:MAG: glycoside hydrolase family 2 protein [Candidatus Aminicenantales bacterium]